jgi:hypothetical protein
MTCGDLLLTLSRVSYGIMRLPIMDFFLPLARALGRIPAGVLLLRTFGASGTLLPGGGGKM